MLTPVLYLDTSIGARHLLAHGGPWERLDGMDPARPLLDGIGRQRREHQGPAPGLRQEIVRFLPLVSVPDAPGGHDLETLDEPARRQPETASRSRQPSKTIERGTDRGLPFLHGREVVFEGVTTGSLFANEHSIDAGADGKGPLALELAHGPRGPHADPERGLVLSRLTLCPAHGSLPPLLDDLENRSRPKSPLENGFGGFAAKANKEEGAQGPDGMERPAFPRHEGDLNPRRGARSRDDHGLPTLAATSPEVDQDVTRRSA